MRRDSGTFIQTTSYDDAFQAFVPRPLPPEPPLVLDDELRALLAKAERELARLNVASTLVPNQDWFIYGFVRKEAVLTSQIEGTQATLEDLLVHEAGHDEPGACDGALPVGEVCNYLAALEYAHGQLADPAGLPLSLRLLREAHRRLLRGARGAGKAPGEFRRSQNWIGGTRPGNAVHVPPPPDQLPACLDAFERFLHQETDLAPLIRVGLLHVQFETIHPFLDGNGRLGRLLIALLLEQWGLLEAPLLYISLFLKQHRSTYYDLLTAVRTEGDWERWTKFFLEAVASTSTQATDCAKQLSVLFESDRKRMLGVSGVSVGALRLLQVLPDHPILSVAHAMELLGTSRPTATKAMEFLLDQGVVEERSGRRRDRRYAYRRYLDILGEGTDLTG